MPEKNSLQLGTFSREYKHQDLEFFVAVLCKVPHTAEGVAALKKGVDLYILRLRSYMIYILVR